MSGADVRRRRRGAKTRLSEVAPTALRASSWALGGAVLVALCSVVWLHGRVPPEPRGLGAESSGAASPIAATPAVDALTVARRETPSTSPVAEIMEPRSTPSALANDMVAPAGGAPDDLVAGPHGENLVPGAKPHPISAEHQRRFREVGIVDSAWEALEARDFARARKLIDEHQREYGGENGDLDEGMSLLADCLARPSAETRGRAQRFYDEETYSTARRRIRRWCLAPDLAQLGAPPR